MASETRSKRLGPRAGGAPMVASSSAASFDNERPLKTYPVSSRLLALRLLQHCRCASCRQPLREPVTLPCGHSTCLKCLIANTQTAAAGSPSTAASMPSTSHLPPRFPLAVTTVPCPMNGCARSAIGRGIGSWKGFSAQYGDEVNQEIFEDTPAMSDGTEGHASAPPLDGFVIPTNSNSTELGIMPPQPRVSFDVKYAISRYSSQPVDLSPERSMLRCDVTLTKAVEALRRLAGVPVDWPMSEVQRPSTAPGTRLPPSGSSSRPVRTQSRVRRRQPGTYSSDEQHAPGSRTTINERFLGVMGASEEGVDSCAVGGMSAVLVEASEEDEEMVMEHETDEQHLAITYDEDDEEIGGAFARRNDLRPSTAKHQHRLLATQRHPYGVSDKRAADLTLLATEIEESLIAEAQWDQEVPEVRAKAIELLHAELLDVLECQLCYMPLFQPLTTPCGHTFCRRCFARSLDHSTSCPLCRDEMPPFSFFQDHPCNKQIAALMTAQIRPNEHTDAALNVWGLAQMYEERKMAIEREERESSLSTPIFVCTLGFPKMPTILHIFEPRYRLMIRRCLESGHPRFGMVLHSQDMNTATPGMSSFGVMLEIKTVQMLPDGRSMIETVGSHRFRLHEAGGLDGYTVGRISLVEDVPPEAESELEQASMGIMDLWSAALYGGSASDSSNEGMNPNSNGGSLSSSGSSGSSNNLIQPIITADEAREAHLSFRAAMGIDSLMRQSNAEPTPAVTSALVQRTTVELMNTCNAFIETLRSGSAPWLITRLNDTYGPMPDVSDVAAFGYWMAMVIPIDEHEKAKLLPIRSARLRLCIVVYWIEQLRQTWWFNHGCSVQ